MKYSFVGAPDMIPDIGDVFDAFLKNAAMLAPSKTLSNSQNEFMISYLEYFIRHNIIQLFGFPQKISLSIVDFEEFCMFTYL